MYTDKFGQPADESWEILVYILEPYQLIAHFMRDEIVWYFAILLYMPMVTIIVSLLPSYYQTVTKLVNTEDSSIADVNCQTKQLPFLWVS